MPKTTQTFGKREQDREIDALWRKIADLEAALNNINIVSTSQQSLTPIINAQGLIGLLTTKGDLLTFGTALMRLGVGSNGDVLTADSGEVSGLKWEAPAAAQVVDYADYSTTTVNLTASSAAIDIANCTNASAVTVNLPTASGLLDHVFIIKRGSAVSSVTVDPNSSETIDGAATKSLDSQYAAVGVVSDGTNWKLLFTYGTVT